MYQTRRVIWEECMRTRILEKRDVPMRGCRWKKRCIVKRSNRESFDCCLNGGDVIFLVLHLKCHIWLTFIPFLLTTRATRCSFINIKSIYISTMHDVLSSCQRSLHVPMPSPFYFQALCMNAYLLVFHIEHIKRGWWACEEHGWRNNGMYAQRMNRKKGRANVRGQSGDKPKTTSRILTGAHKNHI